MMKCWASSWFRKARGPCVTVRTKLSSCWQSLRVMASTLWGHKVGGGRGSSRPCLPLRWEPEGRGGALRDSLTSRPGRWAPGWPPRGCRCLTDCPSPRPCSDRSPGKNCESRGCCPAHPSPRRPAQAGVSRLEEMVRPRASEWPHTHLPGTPGQEGREAAWAQLQKRQDEETRAERNAPSHSSECRWWQGHAATPGTRGDAGSRPGQGHNTSTAAALRAQTLGHSVTPVPPSVLPGRHSFIARCHRLPASPPAHTPWRAAWTDMEPAGCAG